MDACEKQQSSWNGKLLWGDLPCLVGTLIFTHCHWISSSL